MIKIYHNPRCSKSREGVELLKNTNKEFETILYLENNLNAKELSEIINKLNITPEQLLRKNEAIWKEHFKGKTLSADQIIEAMVKYPKLIERPIVINGNKAIIGRPPSSISTIL